MDLDSTVLNYVTANRFYVELESELSACFAECNGLGFTSRVERFYEGGVNDQERILIQPPRFTDVKLRRGITQSLLFWEWLEQIWNPKVTRKRRNVNILVFNQAGETMQCWTLVGAIPTGWRAPNLQARSKSIALEELTLTYEGLKVLTGSGGGGATMLTGRDSLGYFDSSGMVSNGGTPQH